MYVAGRIKTFYLVSLVFLLITGGLILSNLWPLIILAPFLLLFFYYAVFSLDVLFFITVALVPLSVPLRILAPELGFDLSLPAEPLLIVIFLIVFLKTVRENLLPAEFMHHPVTLAIVAYLSWMLVTSVTSTMPLVSLKYFLARLWFIGSAYFFGYLVFTHKENRLRFLLSYILPLTLIIGYTFYHQAHTGFFNQKAAHSAMFPFYNDHTAYGAIVAMFVPVLTGLISLPGKHRILPKGLLFLLLGIFLSALLFSYSRAAWLSVAGMAGIWLLVKVKIRVEIVVAGVVIVVAAFFIFQSTIWMKLQENRQESSGSMAKHLESVTNVRSDASNMERILRWQCALDMFREKPFTGWGPGTYMFQYAPFQRSYNRTIISTNFGDRGNAHSEYLGPLAESGWPGLVVFLAIVFLSVFTGIKTYLRAADKTVRTLSLSVTLGLITYYIHGLLNNFLDTDKASVPFWGFIAMMVILDLQSRIKTGEKRTY